MGIEPHWCLADTHLRLRHDRSVPYRRDVVVHGAWLHARIRHRLLDLCAETGDLGVERDPARREGLAVFECLFWAEVPKRTDPVQRRSEGDMHLVRAALLLCVVMMVSGSYIEGDEMMVDPR